MKKLISILMIVAMLSSMIVAAIPASAATDPETTVDPSKFGNTVITNANREEHIEQLLDEGYIGLVQEVWPDYEEEYGENVKAFADIFKGKENIADGGKFFLLEDIVVPGGYYSANNDTSDGNKPDGVDNFLLDGCGYTLTISKALFTQSKNITFKNVTFKGTLDMGNDFCGAFSVTNRWEQHGQANFENVTSEVVQKNSNRATSQKLAALTISATDSTFKNVKVTADHTLTENATIIDGVGAIVGIVHGNTVFEDCYVEGNTYVNSTTLAGCEGLGGLCGVANGTVLFKNCYNKRNIIISANTTIQAQYTLWKDGDGDGQMDTPTVSKDFNVGGIVGKAGAVTMENCVNEGTITFAGKYQNKDKNATVGGIIGYAANGLKMTNCENKGTIALSGDNSFTATKDFEGQTASATVHHNIAVGGVVGASLNKDTILTNVDNNANITLDKTATNALGGIIGSLAGSNAKLYECYNNGDITMSNGALLSQPSDAGMGIGGVLGLSKVANGTLENCDNNGDINYAVGAAAIGKYTADGAEKKHEFHTGVSGVGGVMGYQYASNAKALSIINCDNNGQMTENADTGRTPFTGGILGGARGVEALLIDKCINNSNITVKKITGWCGVAGILGEYGSIGNWMSSNNPNIEATFDIRGCVNNGNISSNGYTGGIVGENGEVAAVNLKTTLYACVNNGTVTSTASVAGGIYGNAVLKGTLNVQYCINNGAVTAKTRAAGIIANVSCDTVNVKNSKNTAAIKAVDRAGGIVGTATVTKGLDIISSFNSAKVEATASANGVAGGILAYTASSGIKLDKNVNSGKVSNADKTLEAPITVKQVTLATGTTNYFLAGCVTNASGFAGTSKTQAQLDTIVNGMVFATAGDAFHLNKSIAAVDVLVKSDYVTATWTAVANALTNAKSIAGNTKSTQAQIDAAKKTLDDAVAALDPKDLDLTGYDKQYKAYKALNRGDWDSNTYLEVVRAVEAADVLKATENTLQSVFDAAVKLIETNIKNLKPKGITDGIIDVEQEGDFTLPELRPQTTPTTATTPAPTEETTPAPTTAATEPVEEGCGGFIGGAAIVATAVLALGAGISFKKRED